MERSGTEDPVKGRLLKKSAQHREQLEEEVKLVSEQTEKMVINAVIIGGALALTYFLVSQFSVTKSKKKSKAAKIKLVHDKAREEAPQLPSEPEAPGIVSQIGTALATQATVFLLNLAKEKLGEYLQEQSGKKSKTNEPT